MEDWKLKAKTLIKSELAKNDIDYVRLSELMKEQGIEIDNMGLSNKIGRGTFSFTFALQIFEALNLEIELKPKDSLK